MSQQIQPEDDALPVAVVGGTGRSASRRPHTFSAVGSSRSSSRGRSRRSRRRVVAPRPALLLAGPSSSTRSPVDLLDSHGWSEPDPARLSDRREWAEQYLQPLADALGRARPLRQPGHRRRAAGP